MPNICVNRLSLLVCTSLMSVMAWGNVVRSLDSKDQVSWQVFPVDGTSADDVISEGFVPSDYVAGIVPGTVFNAYVEAGREADPTYGDNIYRVDESKYNRSFWYRTEFARPSEAAGKHTVLVFEGTNRYATVYFNGTRLGQIKGHVLKVRYDVTSLLRDNNVLAVKIDLPKSNFVPRNSNFANYVMPTYVAAHSWDWSPYVPGLDTGITNDVYLEFAGDVTLRDPWVRSSLYFGYQRGRVSTTTSLVNLTQEQKTVQVKATVMPGSLSTSKDVTIAAGDSIDVALNNIVIKNPALWWPNGSGPQNLYTCQIDVVENGQVIDTRTETFGLREYKYKTENTALTLYVNGKKVYCKGGNWGLSNFLLNCHGKEYDMRMRLHQDMNYNMVRLWTGCVTDEEFYDACDKYGIMVWDDFWLTGPYTGLTGPDDRTEFVSNARDKVIRLRNHPSVAVWCGCNEGTPYDELNNELINIIKTYDGNDRLYQANSHKGNGLSGSGWWTNFPPEEYFATGIWGGGGDQGDKVDWGFRSELGMGAFTTFESFKEFMPEEDWWPRNHMWELHFFSDSAQYGGGAGSTNYFNTVNKNYGTSSGIEEFCEKAQFMNIEVMKALYEGWQDNLWNTASGLLFWMSQSAYPVFIWQTYDYYYDATGTYWGAKHACEPLHIQWNCSNQNINVVNLTTENRTGLSARVEVFHMDGTPYQTWTTKVDGISAPSNAVTNIYKFTSNNLALGRPCSVSSVADNCPANNATDGVSTTRWSSDYNDNNWIFVDLGEEKEISGVNLSWEYAYGAKYKIQVSNDSTTWTDVYTENNGNGGTDEIRFDQTVRGRYVRMLGIQRGTGFGYSLYEFEVLEAQQIDEEPLNGVYFIRLKLYDESGSLVSQNFYWKTTKGSKDDYSELNNIPKADVKYQVLSDTEEDGTHKLKIRVANNSTTVAFGIRVRLVDATTGKRILPVIMDDNYFTLMPKERRDLTLEYDTEFNPDVTPKVLLKQYGQKESDETPTAINVLPEKEEVQVSVWPNPATNYLHIKADDVASARVFATNGNMVLAAQGNNTLDVSSLSAGVYILEARTSEGVYRTKFIKK